MDEKKAPKKVPKKVPKKAPIERFFYKKFFKNRKWTISKCPNREIEKTFQQKTVRWEPFLEPFFYGLI